MTSDNDTIFVQIASYRDPELQHTLQDLFKKAKNPDRIFVGICHQYDMKDNRDERLFDVPFPRQNQLRIENVDYRETKGCCWARNKIQKLWQQEKWSLMIDSHMRFEENWDETSISMATALIDQGYKPVLTTYVCGYKIGEPLQGFVTNSVVFFDDRKILKTSGGIPLNIVEPLYHGFFAGGFSFASSEYIKDIEYDPSIFFIGEEITMTLRSWTHGYDFFVPHKVIAYHLYNPIGEGQQDRNLVWEDNKEIIENDILSIVRTRHIVQSTISKDKKVLQNIEKYSLGKKRTIRDYERFAGVNFRTNKLRERTSKGIFEQWQEVANIAEVRNIFKNK